MNTPRPHRPARLVLVARLALVALLALVLGACSDTDLPTPEPDVVEAPDNDAGPDTAAPERPRAGVGEPCHSPVDCTEGSSCIGTADGAFVCMAHCPQVGSFCVDGSVCLPVGSGAAAVCYIGGDRPAGAACQTNLDCAPGTVCAGNPADADEAYCLPSCFESAERCPVGQQCTMFNSNRGVCQRTLGAPCDSGDDCADDAPVCHDGACTQSPCTDDTDCPTGGACRRVDDADVCLPTCQTHADCRFYGGQRCLGPADCDGAPSPATCRAFLSDTKLCLTQLP